MNTNDIAIGYTLAREHLYCDFVVFNKWACDFLGRPISLQEYGEEVFWNELRTKFEASLKNED